MKRATKRSKTHLIRQIEGTLIQHRNIQIPSTLNQIGIPALEYVRSYKRPRASRKQIREAIYDYEGPLRRGEDDPHPLYATLETEYDVPIIGSKNYIPTSDYSYLTEPIPFTFSRGTSLRQTPNPKTLPQTFLPSLSPQAVAQRLSLPDNISISQLDNGCTVASLNNNLPFGHLRLYLKSGSRYESFPTLGFSHILKHLAFTRTLNRSPVRLGRELEHLTTQYSSTSTREHNIISSDLISENIQYTLPIFLDVTRPKVREYIIREASESVHGDLAFKNSYQTVIDELHGAAYRHMGLGRSIWGNKERVTNFCTLDLGLFEQWILDRYQPENMVVVAVGGNMDHSQFRDYTHAAFESLEEDQEFEADTDYQPTASTVDAHLKKIGADKGRYVGGEAVAMDPSYATYSHVAIGFEGSRVLNKERLYGLKVVEQLLGYKTDGGFNKATGMGVYGSRVGVFGESEMEGLQVASVFNESYSDNGLWGVHAQVSANVHVQEAVEMLVDGLRRVGKDGVEEEVLEGAKRRAEAVLRREVETVGGLGSFYGRQVAASHNSGGEEEVLGLEEAVKVIRGVTGEGIRKLISGEGLGAASLVARGNVEGIMKLSDLSSKLSEIKY